MNITTRTFKSVEELFNLFNHDVDLSKVTSATCIAHSDSGGGDDVASVYEIYIDNTPHYFGIVIGDQQQELEEELKFIKAWSEAKNATLVDHVENDYYISISLYELTEPFGIRFTE